ncbi:MAG: FG-GAP-like repeat-containing protein, partial [Blastocatellia bacterium]
TNVGGLPFDIAVSDFNGDGKQDFALTKIAVTDGGENRVQVFIGDGAGRFSATGELPIILPLQVNAADLNSDGLPDLVVATSNPASGGGNAWSFLNRCNPPPSNTLVSVSAASFRRLFLASESIVAAFGVGLSAETVIASTLPLPTQLTGTSVKVKDSAGVERLAPLFFVSPNQVNYLMPAGTAIGTATVAITGANGNTVSSATQIAAVAPGLFTANATGQGAPAGVLLRVQGDGQQVFLPLARFDSASNQIVPVPISLSVLGPTLDRVFLILFGTGMRGGAGTKVELMIGERKFDVLYAGPQGDFVGVDQINVEILRGFLPFGDYDVTVTVNGRVANPVRIILAN